MTSILHFSDTIYTCIFQLGLGPNLRKDIHQLEMVQRRAARFIKPDYSYDNSVSQMLKDIDLHL